MSSVSVGLDDIRFAMTICRDADRILKRVSKKLNNSYREAGEYWRDDKYRQLGEIIGDCTAALDAPTYELNECARKLRDLENAVQSYLGESLDANEVFHDSSNIRRGAYYPDTQDYSSISSRDEAVISAMEGHDSPNAAAYAIAVALRRIAPGIDMDATARSVQMVLNAGYTTTQAFVKTLHRQYPPPQLPLEGVDYYFDEDGNPVWFHSSKFVKYDNEE